MGLGALLALAIASIGSAVTGSLISKKQSDDNIDYQKEANQQNIDLQREVNAQNQYNFEHEAQIRMADYEAAGINPVLAAQGGFGGTPLANISSANVKAPQADYGGISSAISSAINSMTMLTMANSMAKNQQALLAGREAGKDSRLARVLAARQARNNASFSAKPTNNFEKALKKVIEDEGDPNDWSFLDD